MTDTAYQRDPRLHLRVRLTGDRLAVCRLDAGSAVPAWATGAPGFVTISQTADEVSVICRADAVPPSVRHEAPFRLMHVVGPLPFDAVGIMARLSGALAAAGVSLLPIATFDTDYVLVREGDVERSVRALGEAGCTIEAVDALAGPAANPSWSPTPTVGEAQGQRQPEDGFLGMLSHELRTPLNAILGWTRVLRTSSEPTVGRTGLDAVERNARVLTHLVDDLLDVSRLASGDVRLALAPVDLAVVLQAAVDATRAVAEARDVALVCEIDDRLPALDGDAARLQQIAWNLLSNAVKFTPPGGRVTLGAQGEAGHVRVVVADTGRGIAPEYLPEVFDHFSQADNSASRLHGGLGLGLAIVRRLVELHGGTVGAESGGIGQGARFTVRLPARAAISTNDPPA